MSADLLALAAVGVLACAHLLAPVLAFVRVVPRSGLLSAFGGISVAYVFVHLLPEVAEAQAAMDRAGLWPVGDLERHTWLLALVGLVVFYGLEHLARASRDEGAVGPVAFWVAVVSFAAYNVVVGVLAVRRAEDDGLVGLAVFVVALGVHLVVNDLGLRHHHHHRRYDRLGRPLLAAAVVGGWLLATLVEISDAAIGVAIALLAGGIVLNVVKEELPQERAARFGPFAAAATGYAALLLLV